MTIDKEVIMGVLSITSAIVSGYMLYKSNISKDKTKTYIETLDAEGEFRDELLKNIVELKSVVEKLSGENSKLKEDLYNAKMEMKSLEIDLSNKVDKCKIIEIFLSHLTTPAWVRLIDKDGTFRCAYVNFSFCNYFDVSREYCLGQDGHSFINEHINDYMNGLSNNVLIKKIGTRGRVVINDNALTVLKFPIIESGYIIGIGGIFINCEED